MTFINKNKIFNHILILTTCCFLLTGCKNDDTEKSSNAKSAADQKSSSVTNGASGDTSLFETDIFTVDLSSHWVYDSAASEKASAASGVKCYYFYHKDNSDTSSANRHITISIEDLSSTGKDFATFKDVIKGQINTDTYTMVSAEDSTVSGYNSWKVKYDTAVSDTLSHNYLSAVNVENVICSFTFTTAGDDYDSFFEEADNLVGSVVFK